jgi:spermidine/putrescine transport system substrate-binding protein
MTIPITAKNPVDAIELLDFFYRPEIAGTLAEYINYVSPVPGAKQQIDKDAAAAKGDDKATLQQVATSDVVFPGDDIYKRLHYYVTFDSVTESQTFNKLFEPIVLG